MRKENRCKKIQLSRCFLNCFCMTWQVKEGCIYGANSLPALISISHFSSKCVPALYIYIWAQWQNYKRTASFNRVAHTDLCTSWAFIRRSQQNQSWCCITYSLRDSLSSLPPTSRFCVSSMLTAHFIPLKTLDLWKGKGFIRQADSFT